MILTKEDYNGLVQVLAIINRIVKNAVMSELEEEHERDFEKLTKIKENKAFEFILSKRRNQMPQKYKTIFTEQWFDDHTRLKPNGVYEIRCSINKIPISGSSKDLDTAIRNFIKALSKAGNAPKPKAQKIKRVLLLDFAEKWFEVVKKPTVKPITYDSLLNVYRVHIKPYFKGKYIDELTAMQIQPLFSKLYKVGKTKVAVTLNLILNQIFKAAIAERLITFNPMDGVTILKHHAKKGAALTYAEEKEFLQKLETSKFKLTFAIMLFGGMRRAELGTAKFDENFITVKNGKQRLSENQTERKIPITPMLRSFLANASKKELKEAIGHSCDLLSRSFKALCPSHHLHELRHTFITRCQECGVPREVVSVWAGHTADSTMTTTVYTHFSEEFMLSEGKKVDYFSRLYNSK